MTDFFQFFPYKVMKNLVLMEEAWLGGMIQI